MKSFVFSVLMQARKMRVPITVFVSNGFQMRGYVAYVDIEAFWLSGQNTIGQSVDGGQQCASTSHVVDDKDRLVFPNCVSPLFGAS